MTRVIVAGAAGRMGQRIIHMVQAHPGLELAGAFEASTSPAIGRDAGAISGLGETGVAITAGLESVIDRGEVLIDFTFHTATVGFARLAAENGLAMVIGTTGLSNDELAEIRMLAAAHFLAYSRRTWPSASTSCSNWWLATAAVLGDGYDIEIVEAHHRMKKDAPSGTALRLGQMAAEALGRNLDEVGVMERNGIIGARTDQEIGIQTIRGGDIVGEHTVYFAGAGERLEITHRATSRDNFARGRPWPRPGWSARRTASTPCSMCSTWPTSDPAGGPCPRSPACFPVTSTPPDVSARCRRSGSAGAHRLSGPGLQPGGLAPDPAHGLESPAGRNLHPGRPPVRPVPQRPARHAERAHRFVNAAALIHTELAPSPCWRGCSGSSRDAAGPACSAERYRLPGSDPGLRPALR